MTSRQRASTGTKVRAAGLMHFFDVADKLGFNAYPLLRKLGLNPRMFEHRDQMLPAEAVIRLLEESAHASGCPVYGLLMAEPRQISSFGAISLLLSHQRTLRDVLNTIMRYRNLLNEALALHVETVGAITVLREEIITDIPQPSRQATELAVAVLFLACRTLLGSRWRPSSVNFTHQAPKDMQAHRRIFQCKLVFDSEFNGIVCPTQMLEIPNPHTDPAMMRYAQHFIETLPGNHSGTPVQEVRKSIYLLLPMGLATLEQVAQGLALNARSLQRRLNESGETFGSLINGVRRELALRYMENPSCTLGHIAEQLGYGNPSSFTRWFTTQFGMPPARWRAAHGARYRRPLKVPAL